MPMPCAMASAGEEKLTSSPSTSMVPSSGFCTPYRIFISVDLPAPFSPTRACTVPRADRDVDVVVGDHAGEALADPA